MLTRNPLEWGLDKFGLAPATTSIAPLDPSLARSPAKPVIRHVDTADLAAALRAGYADFAAARTDVVMLCVLYPVIGLLLARLAFHQGLLPILFPMAAGFALLGPLFGVGLAEMSRRRERGVAVGWSDAFAVARSPSFGPILLLGLLLLAIFLAWLVAAAVIYDATLGPLPPASIAAFAHDVLATPAGWAMIAVGMGVGFLFALAVLAISLVSFPILLDRAVGVDVAIATSLRAARANPRAMAAWGALIAAGLLLGSVPLFLGLAVVMPVFGHATWHLYRKLVAP